MRSVATPRWGLAFWERAGRMRVAVTGPESRASHAPVPEDATFFGVDFALGTTMPHLSIGDLVDNQVELPDATRQSFWLAARPGSHPTTTPPRRSSGDWCARASWFEIPSWRTPSGPCRRTCPSVPSSATSSRPPA